MRWLALSTFVATSAFAHGARFGFHAQLGPSWVNYDSRPKPARVVPVIYPYPIYWYWFPAQAYQPPPPPPAPIVIEREIIREEPAPPPPPPQVIIIEQPAPAPAPAPVAAAPAPVEPAKPLPPRTPGPDVYSWVDDDGVVHYSTRVPAQAKAKAKKLSTLSK